MCPGSFAPRGAADDSLLDVLNLGPLVPNCPQSSSTRVPPIANPELRRAWPWVVLASPWPKQRLQLRGDGADQIGLGARFAQQEALGDLQRQLEGGNALLVSQLNNAGVEFRGACSHGPLRMGLQKVDLPWLDPGSVEVVVLSRLIRDNGWCANHIWCDLLH